MEVDTRPLGRGVIAGVIAPIVVAIGAMAADYVHAGLAGGTCFDIAWTAASVSALVGMLTARRHANSANRMRWTLWALAAAAWLVGQLFWDLYGIIGFPSSPNLADISWWLFALLVIFSMLRLPQGPRSIQAVAAIESIPLVCAAIALCVGELWSDAVHSQLPLAAQISAIAYPVLYVSAAVVTLQAMLAGTLRGMRSLALRLILLGIAAEAAAFIPWSRQLLDRTYVPGSSPLDPIWVLSLAAIGIGAMLAARAPERAAEPAEPSHLGAILPAGLFLGLFAALIVALVVGIAPDGAVALRIGLLFSGAALIARSSLLGRRLAQMLSRERASLAMLAEREAELARLNEQLVEDSRLDPLTGIGNRRALSDDLPMYETLQREHAASLAVALCDVDHFKAYNDRLGHLAGDQALRMLANIARGALRGVDTAYRFGGEELLLILREVTQEEAVQVGERVRAAVQQAAFLHPDGEEGVLTVSVGVACGEAGVGELLAQADAALYEAKHLGRNRVVAADHLTATRPPRQREEDAEGPVPRHLRGMLGVSRAAAAGQGVMPVLEALAEAIRTELSFHVVAVNLLEPDGEQLRVVVVLGDPDARETLLGTHGSLESWEQLLAAGQEIHGAAWLKAGSYEQPDGPVWTPTGVPSPATEDWHPEDMLLLPLRDAAGALIGVVSVDQPLLGRRPTEAEIAVLMAVADHAGLAIEQIRREDAATDGSDELRLAAVMLLAETLDLRDPSTALHSRTVGRLARQTAVALGLPEAHVERIHAAGVLHDLGKLGIADAILHKPGPLDEAEWDEMRCHPEVGARILEHAGMVDIAGWVRAHHERVDGRGYPAGIGDGQIPLEARVLAVADAYEAMVADRPYRAGMTPAAAREELLRCAGEQFDVEVVSAFLRALEHSEAAEATAPLERVA